MTCLLYTSSEDAFLEYAEYVGNFYGTPKRFVDEAMEQGKDVILDIEVQGALQVVHKRPDVVRIFISPPSWQALEERLDVYKRQARGCTAHPLRTKQWEHCRM